MSPLTKLILLTVVFTILVVVVYVLVVRAFYWSGRQGRSKPQNRTKDKEL